MKRKNYLITLPDTLPANTLYQYDKGIIVKWSEFKYQPTIEHYKELRAHVMKTPKLRIFYNNLMEKHAHE